MFCNLYFCFCFLGRGSFFGCLEVVEEEEEGFLCFYCLGSS